MESDLHMIVDREECCGCGMCEAVCPNNAIEMKQDVEGFLYPSTDKSLCIECDLCGVACPVRNRRDTRDTGNVKAYIIQNRKTDIIKESTSGGAFSAVAEWVISKGGVVCGAVMSEELVVHHEIVDNVDDLSRFRNSKYVQSKIEKETTRKLKKLLEEGVLVCFSGTPCQIEGVNRFLKKNYNNMIYVDVVCRAVASPMIFQKYVDYQRSSFSDRITNVRFRDKYYGYDWSTISLEADGKTIDYHRGIESDPFLRAFFHGICNRPSCHDCKFRGIDRISDFTLWDCLRVWRFTKELDNDKGATRVLARTARAQEILEDIKASCTVFELAVNDAVRDTKEFKESPMMDSGRNEFFADAVNMSGKDLFSKYFSQNIKTRTSNLFRKLLCSLGVYSYIKKICLMITRR